MGTIIALEGQEEQELQPGMISTEGLSLPSTGTLQASASSQVWLHPPIRVRGKERPSHRTPAGLGTVQQPGRPKGSGKQSLPHTHTYQLGLKPSAKIKKYFGELKSAQGGNGLEGAGSGLIKGRSGP